jgi:hypothetical protein
MGKCIISIFLSVCVVNVENFIYICTAIQKNLL